MDYNPGQERYVHLRPLDVVHNFLMCPISVLLIVALRNGQASGKTHAEVLQSMQNNKGHTTTPRQALTVCDPIW